MKIKVEPFYMKKGNRVGRAAIEFDKNDGVLAGFYLVGFTICEDPVKGVFVLFPSTFTTEGDKRQFYFLRPFEETKETKGSLLEKLENDILDVYDSMIGYSSKDGTKLKRAGSVQTT